MPLLGPKVGFGPRWLQPWLKKLKKCSELSVDNCPEGATDGCCVVVPCEYCLHLVFTASGQEHWGSASWTGQTWRGAVNGIEWEGYWRKYAGACQWRVLYGGAEVDVENCQIQIPGKSYNCSPLPPEQNYGAGVSCRDSSGSAEVSVGGYAAVLTWTVQRDLPLPYAKEFGCSDFFCGACECTCETLCATVTTAAPGCRTCKGSLPHVSYCEGSPVLWIGTVVCETKTYNLSVSLSRGPYEECLLTMTVNGDTMKAYAISSCTGISATWTLYDGTLITVECMKCSCDREAGCKTGCCWPLVFPPEYPCGHLVSINGVLSAPCPGFYPKDVLFNLQQPVLEKGTCGPCGVYPADVLTGFEGQRPSLMADPVTGYCAMTPCSMNICLYLECDPLGSPGYLGQCCGSFRLWIGTPERMVGDVGDYPGNDPITVDCQHWFKVSPDSCACLPGNAGAMLKFTFSLNGVCADKVVGGPCDGEPLCCKLFCAGPFTLTI